MNQFEQFWTIAVDLVWGLPLVAFILAIGIYFSYVSRLKPLKGFFHAFAILSGKYDNKDDPGELSHFQALTVALSGTIGMGNIAGVAIAISLGGAGAIFWMWVAGLFGMIIKFFTCTLACLYRQKDEDGIDQGGPMYFIESGLGKKYKPLAILFAMAGIIGCMPLFQVNQLASLLHNELSIEPLHSGLVALVLIGIIIIGDVKRVGIATAGIVPFMFLAYVISSLVIIIINFDAVPVILIDIVKSAFGTEAIYGGATGLVFKEVLVTGIKRAIFSNEAGVGTEVMAHGAAKTKEPVREGLVAMLGPFIDTHIVCTCTALVILSSGVNPMDSGVLMTAESFNQSLPGVGKLIVYFVFTLFALSTMITYSYYSLKCARYLFGKKNGNKFIFVYLAIIPMSAIWSQATIINIIDTMFALMIFPTLLATVLLSRKVIAEMHRYFDKL
ncbi:MAG TPA: sodium:alanine symporter family protein [Thiotrichaceae bacterium]|nr:sodium:alanine symporter family protein [Thiotrichaceae bacterium]HIM08987.1 sodium:alanine symporter family protein [Gammaproteobacteria bacterium]